jgi:hypothetical protein
MANSATVTAKTGPAIQATALSLTGVTGINFDLSAGVVFINQGSKVNQFQLTGSNTITLTASGSAYTLTIS